jgi:hypothetical protein
MGKSINCPKNRPATMRFSAATRQTRYAVGEGLTKKQIGQNKCCIVPPGRYFH